jgi:hypothetical protein
MQIRHQLVTRFMIDARLAAPMTVGACAGRYRVETRG